MRPITTLLFVFFAAVPTVFGQQSILSRAADKLADNTLRVLKTAVPEGSKLTVMNFGMVNAYADTVKTAAGIEFSRLFVNTLNQKIHQKKLNYTVLIPNAEADKLTASFTLPPGEGAGDFYKRYFDNITPDFVITGSWTHASYKNFATQNVQIRPVSMQSAQKLFSVENVTLPVETSADRAKLIETETADSPEKLALAVAVQIMSQTRIRNIKLSPPVHETSGSATQFSHRLADLIEQELSQKGSYAVVRNATRGIRNHTDNTPHVLDCKYNIEGDKLYFNFRLVNDETSAVVSSASMYIPLESVKRAGVPYEPENKAEAEARLEVLETDKPDATLNIAVLTNKGNDSPKFAESEILTLSVTAAEPCYIRFVYLMADGTAVLLLDNLQLDQSKCGKPYAIPQTFECAEPFGTETLMLQARNDKPFDTLSTHTQSGYTFIDEPLKDIIAKGRRGMKPQIKTAQVSVNILTAKR